MNKMCEFKMFLEDCSPDIIAITETWLDASIPSTMFVDLSTSWCFRKDRSTCGGGVCLLIKRSLNVVVTQTILPDDYADLELLAVDISSNPDVLPFRIIVAYRPPDSTREVNDLLVSALDWLCDGSARVCVLGDLNLSAFDWDQFTYPPIHLYSSFANFICSHGLSQIVDQPTRGNNILDVVLCSDVLCCDDVDVLPPISTSDHYVVCFNLSLCFAQQQQSANEMSSRHNFSKADWDGICGFLSAVDWNLVFLGITTADELRNAFTGVVQLAIDQFVPRFKYSKHMSSTKFYPRHIRKLLAEKRTRWKIFHKFRTPELKAKYKTIANKCRKEIMNFAAQKEEQLCDNANLYL